MQGSLHLTDHYWSPGMSTWLPLSTIINTQPLNPAKTAERSLTSALVSLFVSWLLTVIIGVLILGLVGYGNSGADGAGRLIGTYVGLLILVRPLFLVIEIISRAITGKRGVDLLAP
jgi:ABC-type transporter Mla maintaining outer membrane lipid asymmetry permease subunit MlaE